MALFTTTTSGEFTAKVLESDKPVLVDFWADWCAPCHAMAPVLEKVANNLDGTADIVKVNIEASADNQQLASQYDVRSIPNLVLFKSGKEADRIIGMTRGAVIHEKLEALAS